MIEIRQLTLEGRSAALDLLLALDAGDRYRRFGCAMSDDLIRRYFDRVDWSRTVILGAFVRDRLVGVVEIVSGGALPSGSAELAVAVASTMRRRGIGGALVDRGLRLASASGARLVVMSFVAENEWIPRIARVHGGTVVRNTGEVTIPVAARAARRRKLGALTQRIEHRADLMFAMMERLDIDPVASTRLGLGTTIADAARQCLFCRNADVCSVWLGSSDAPDGYRRFCPNAPVFDQMLRRPMPTRAVAG